MKYHTYVEQHCRWHRTGFLACLETYCEVHNFQCGNAVVVAARLFGPHGEMCRFAKHGSSAYVHARNGSRAPLGYSLNDIGSCRLAGRTYFIEYVRSNADELKDLLALDGDLPAVSFARLRGPVAIAAGGGVTLEDLAKRLDDMAAHVNRIDVVTQQTLFHIRNSTELLALYSGTQFTTRRLGGKEIRVEVGVNVDDPQEDLLPSLGGARIIAFVRAETAAQYVFRL